jgi:hypothetical protein
MEYRLNGCFTMTSFVARARTALLCKLQASRATRSSMPLQDGCRRRDCAETYPGGFAKEPGTRCSRRIVGEEDGRCGCVAICILSAWAHAATCGYMYPLHGRMRRRVAWGTKPVTVHGMIYDVTSYTTCEDVLYEDLRK